MDTGTSAPHQHYPEIKPAPRATDKEWVRDTRPPAAADQTYPEIVPAPKAAEKLCHCCGKPV